MSLTPTPLVGTVDGVNNTFTVPELYQPNTLEVQADGKVLLLGVDYTVSGLTVVTTVPPITWIAGTWTTAQGLSATHYVSADELSVRVGGSARWIELTDDNKDGIPDADIIEDVLSQLDSEVNGYASTAGYGTPLLAIQTNNIKSTMLDIANYRLKTRGDKQPSDDDRLLFTQAIKVMEFVSTHEIALGVVPEESTFELESARQIFSRNSLRGF
jgi:phage gp36-like protein